MDDTKRKRGELTLQFLQLIGEIGADVSDHIVGFLHAGYGASLRKMEYETSKARQRREHAKAVRENKEQLFQRYYLMTSRLKADGLIVEKEKKGKRFIFLTDRGHFKAKQLANDVKRRLSVQQYSLLSGDQLLIVSFDVPEKDRRKRAWLRSVLKNLGLKMVQQSLWVGKGKLPNEFINDLQRMCLIKFVEVFAVTKAGSLHHIE